MRIALLTLLLLANMACAPTHVIRPYPNFIQAGVQVGEKVTIQTVADETVKMKVSEVSADGVSGSGITIPYNKIRAVSKRAYRTPEVPCGGEQPLGCSIPAILTLINGVSENTDGFKPACVQHDFCYRHGQATYGKDRNACDLEFRTNLKAQCEEPKWLTALSLTLNKKRCLFVANQMYQAVRRYGKSKFQLNNSSYCEYDGPTGAVKQTNSP